MLHDVRTFYRTFTPFLNNKKVKDKTDITLHIQGTLLQDQRSVAEQFADYFSTLGESSFDNGPAMNLTTEECDRPPSVPAIRSRWNSNSLSSGKSRKRKLFLSFKNLNTNKAIGFNMIPSRALKIAAQELADPLTTIFNQCITEKTSPNI